MFVWAVVWAVWPVTTSCSDTISYPFGHFCRITSSALLRWYVGQLFVFTGMATTPPAWSHRTIRGDPHPAPNPATAAHAATQTQRMGDPPGPSAPLPPPAPYPRRAGVSMSVGAVGCRPKWVRIAERHG